MAPIPASSFLSLDSIDVKGKRVLVRCDLNVPIKEGKVTDPTRIDRVAPTLQELIDKEAKVIVLSHLGRPKGKKDPSLSLEALVNPLSDALYGASVSFVPECVGPKVEKAISKMQDGEVLLLENVRFHKEEEENDSIFAQKLAHLADIYVNDAFATAHRAHASVEALPHLMPMSLPGRLMEAELSALHQVLENPERPVMAIIGGSKISTKLCLIYNLLEKVDILVLGGAMANTFLWAQGYTIGKSLYESDMKKTVLSILEKAHQRNKDIILPSDVIVTEEIQENVSFERVTVDQIPADKKIVDIGSTTIKAICAHMKACKSLVWNGPLGVFEIPPFDKGTEEVSACAAAQTQAGTLLSVAGGGDTIAALSKAGTLADFSYVSTAGGAFLEWLEGKELPGIIALKRHT